MPELQGEGSRPKRSRVPHRSQASPTNRTAACRHAFLCCSHPNLSDWGTAGKTQRMLTTLQAGETITPSVRRCSYRKYALTIARVAEAQAKPARSRNGVRARSLLQDDDRRAHARKVAEPQSSRRKKKIESGNRDTPPVLAGAFVRAKGRQPAVRRHEHLNWPSHAWTSSPE